MPPTGCRASRSLTARGAPRCFPRAAIGAPACVTQRRALRWRKLTDREAEQIRGATTEGKIKAPARGRPETQSARGVSAARQLAPSVPRPNGSSCFASENHVPRPVGYDIVRRSWSLASSSKPPFRVQAGDAATDQDRGLHASSHGSCGRHRRHCRHRRPVAAVPIMATHRPSDTAE